MTRAPSNYTHQKKFWTLSVTLSVLLFTYLSLVGLTISNTLDRQRAQKATTDLQARVSELEFSYVALNSSMTLEKASTLGFVEVPDFQVARADSVAILR